MKKLLFAALAGLLAFSCQKSNDDARQSGETRKITVTIRKESASRSTLGSTVVKDNETALKDGKIFFFNAAGSTVYTHSLTAENIAAGTFTIENVAGTSVSAAMIANNAETEIATAAPATFAAFKELRYGIDNQAKMAGATGSAGANMPNAVQGIALMDKLGAAGAANLLTPVAGQADTYRASITLVPAVSRIEIAADAIKIKAGNATGLASFDFDGVYVNNYSAGYTLGLSQDQALLGAGIQDGELPNWATSYKGLTPSVYLYHELADAVPLTVTPAASTGGYAFHVFPGILPHLVFRGKNFVYLNEGSVTDARYWLVDKYWNAGGDPSDAGYVAGKGTPINAFEGGWVYKISSVILGDTFPGKDPYDEKVTIEVVLTVQKWQEAAVYIEPR